MSNTTKNLKRECRDGHLQSDLSLEQYLQAAMKNIVHQTHCREPKTY